MGILKSTKLAKTSEKVKPRRKSMRGALAAVGGLLIASAIMRTVVGAGEAFAREGDETAAMTKPEQHVVSETDQSTEMAALVPQSPSSPGVPQNSGSTIQRVADEEIMPLIEALNEREARIKKREEDIKIRMQALSLAEKEIDRKLVELEEAEQKLRATLALAQTAAEDDLSRLTDVYANMKPKQAAALFEEMDPEFAAGFLGRMRPDAAAGIMAGLTPGTAYTISVVLAGRNANVPKQ